MNKYCRICWNTLNWQQPSGEAKNLELGKSYVTEHGFGHEEWLFNFEWLLPGYKSNDLHTYKYGFLQPINKYRDTYIGTTFSVLLYTVDQDREPMFVAKIDNLYVPDNKELDWVLGQTVSKGWLDVMRDQVRDLKIPVDPLQNPAPSTIANIRFLQENVTFYQPMSLVPDGHKVRSINRYQPLDWDDGFQPDPPILKKSTPPKKDEIQISKLQSEAERTRAAQQGITYDPRHTILQNRIYQALCTKYGSSSVKREEECVDLKLIEPDRVTYIEIKMDLTVKSCIRAAIGQLLEYAYYPNLKKADTLLIVGDQIAKPEDEIYLDFIRKTFKLPVFYAQWSRTLQKLELPI